MTHRFSFGLFVGLLLLCSVFAGCGSQQTSVPKEERVVTDTTGREVHLPGEVKSIAVVPIPWASVAFAVDGSADRIAGMHPSAKASYEKSMLKMLGRNRFCRTGFRYQHGGTWQAEPECHHRLELSGG